MAEEFALTISESETPDFTEKSSDGPEPIPQEASIPIVEQKPDEAKGQTKPHHPSTSAGHEKPGLTGEPVTDGAHSSNQAENINSELAATANKDARSPDSPGARMRTKSSGNAIEMQSIRNIKVKVEAVLGGLSMPVSQLAQIKYGEIIHLDRQIGEEIEITANGQLIGRGEIVVVEDDVPKFGITLTEIY